MNEEQIQFVRELTITSENHKLTVGELMAKIQAKFPEMSEQDAHAAIITSAFMQSIGIW